MTKAEVSEAIHDMIDRLVVAQGGPTGWSYKAQVEQIFRLMGKLSPEHKSRSEVPAYDLKLVRRAGEKYQFSEQERLIARDIMKGFTLES